MMSYAIIKSKEYLLDFYKRRGYRCKKTADCVPQFHRRMEYKKRYFSKSQRQYEDKERGRENWSGYKSENRKKISSFGKMKRVVKMEKREKKAIIAIMYDFDKTLCTKDMQEYSFIPKINMKPDNFWTESNDFAKEQKMDGILAYMYKMLQKSTNADISIRRDDFVELGKDLEFFPGVEDWFSRVKQFGKELDVVIEHYVISSGLREIIEGSKIFSDFKKVFASEFLYNASGVACWPKMAVNYTAKTQFLFRINKGVLDLSNDAQLNLYTPEEERRVPFRNMIYIGDGLTDVPCMKLVKVNGGYSIAVYQNRKKHKVRELLEHDRVDYLALADYSENSDLDILVRDMLCKIAKDDALNKKSYKQKIAIKERVKQNR